MGGTLLFIGACGSRNECVVKKFAVHAVLSSVLPCDILGKYPLRFRTDQSLANEFGRWKFCGSLFIQ